MLFDLQQLTSSHEELNIHLKQYGIHIDFKTRLILLSETKKLLAVYFKESLALNKILLQQRNTAKHFESTMNRYVGETHAEGKRIIDLIQKYDANTDEKKRFKFQMDIAEALSLLEHRIGIEKKYFIPEYILTLKNSK
ncbi:MAG TPA: hypothetical protein EYG66_05595 [Mariprofundaceae bacterium]|nr:hypothetical protein [Mariprofundaceae bacterium]